MNKSKKGMAPTQGSPSMTQASSPTGSGAMPQQPVGGSNAFIQEQLGLSNGPSGLNDTAVASEASDLSGAITDHSQSPQTGEKPKDTRIILSADKGGNPFSMEFWSELHFGHCWIDIFTANGQKDSWGYTASNPGSFPRFQPWKSVPGEVLNPDDSVGPTGTLTRHIDEDQLKNAEDWGNAVGNTYNLFGLDGGQSCATFAKGFFERATGEKAPSSMFGALIANPNDLSASINRQAEKEQEKDREVAAREDRQLES